jgi:hypothetical protein
VQTVGFASARWRGWLAPLAFPGTGAPKKLISLSLGLSA